MHGTRRLLAVGGLVAVLVGLTALPASAHVTVSSPNAVQGGFGVITFRVPTESDTASTVKLTVRFPADQPLAFASVRPVPGWAYSVTKTKLATPIKTDDGEVTEAVSTIEWTASGGAGIRPGEFNEFAVSAGPLPQASSMVFKAIQTYSDGKQVAWIEEPVGGTEPAHPAPTLTLVPASGGSGNAAPAAAAPAAAAPAASSGTARTALVLGVLGLLAGLAGLGVALASRRSAPASVASPEREPSR